jgi:hypothetical protein
MTRAQVDSMVRTTEWYVPSSEPSQGEERVTDPKYDASQLDFPAASGYRQIGCTMIGPRKECVDAGWIGFLMSNDTINGIRILVAPVASTLLDYQGVEIAGRILVRTISDQCGPPTTGGSAFDKMTPGSLKGIPVDPGKVFTAWAPDPLTGEHATISVIDNDHGEYRLAIEVVDF